MPTKYMFFNSIAIFSGYLDLSRRVLILNSVNFICRPAHTRKLNKEDIPSVSVVLTAWLWRASLQSNVLFAFNDIIAFI